jgi:hypothetical protein
VRKLPVSKNAKDVCWSPDDNQSLIVADTFNMPQYQCIQFGNCPRADACEKIEIKSDDVFECPRGDPGCRQLLVELRRPPKAKIALIGLPLAVVIGLGVWICIQANNPPPVQKLLTEIWPWLEVPPDR